MSITAASVMDASAALLNDVGKTAFTYTIQIPYLNMALSELQEILEQNNIPYSNKVSAVLVVTTAMTDIGGTTGPALPTDLIEIQSVNERLTGTTNDFTRMTRLEFLPLTSVKTTDLIYWSFNGQIIQFIGATTPRDIKLEYDAARISPITSSSDAIDLFNAKSWLQYRTAALCAQFSGENPTRATELNNSAQFALDRFLSINTKGGQSVATRRRPFMAGWKSRGYIN